MGKFSSKYDVREDAIDKVMDSYARGQTDEDMEREMAATIAAIQRVTHTDYIGDTLVTAVTKMWEYLKATQSALGTEEDWPELAEVASAAHRAELKWASLCRKLLTGEHVEVENALWLLGCWALEDSSPAFQSQQNIPEMKVTKLKLGEKTRTIPVAPKIVSEHAEGSAVLKSLTSADKSAIMSVMETIKRLRHEAGEPGLYESVTEALEAIHREAEEECPLDAPTILSALLNKNFHEMSESEAAGYAGAEGDLWVWHPVGEEVSVVLDYCPPGRVVIQIHHSDGRSWQMTEWSPLIERLS